MIFQPDSRILLHAFVAVLAICPAGCSVLSSNRATLTGRPTFGESGDKSEELAPRQTVQACLKTAEELALQGHAREASLLYEKARGLDPKATDYARRLAPLHDMQNDVSRASTEFQAALASTPNDADLLNDVACFNNRQGNFAEGERLLRRALEVSPQHQRAAVNLGITLANQGRYQEAFERFSAIVGPAAAHNNVGMLLAKEGRRDDALQAFNQALALDPNLPQARAAREYLGHESAHR